MALAPICEYAQSFSAGDIALCQSALVELKATFHETFEIWLPHEGWQPSMFFKTEEVDPLTALESVNKQDWPKLCKLVAGEGAPQLQSLSGKRCLVGIPILDDSQQLHAVALCEFVTTDSDLLLRLSEAFLYRRSLCEENRRIRRENESFVHQVTQDFEELMFLRSMAQQLHLADRQFDLGSISENILPLLNDSVRADSLTLHVDQNKSSEYPVLAEVGQTSVAPGVRQRIVANYRRTSAEQPVVRNNVQQSDEQADYPGVRNFVVVPVQNNSETLGWLLAVNRAHSHRAELEDWQLGHHEFGTHEATLMATAASIMGTQSSNMQLLREKEQLLVSVVRAMVSAIEAKDEYTRGHSERVALYGRCLASHLGYSHIEAERLYLTGLLHDVGKIGVSDATLKKPGRLTDEEFDEIKRHPDEGWAILHGLNPLNYVLPGVLQHHERFDGKGYPDGLAGQEISLDGRILAVADAYDAMTSDRAYRKGMPVEKAESILQEGSGTQWDARVIEAFFEVRDQINEIRTGYTPRRRDSRTATNTPNDGCQMSQVQDDQGEVLTWS